MVLLLKLNSNKKTQEGAETQEGKACLLLPPFFRGPKLVVSFREGNRIGFPPKNTCFAKLYPVQSRFIHVPGFGKSKFDTYVLKRASNLRSYEEESLKLEGKHRTSVRPPWIKTWVNRNESTTSSFCLSSHTSSIQGATHTSNMCSFSSVKGGN